MENRVERDEGGECERERERVDEREKMLTI